MGGIQAREGSLAEVHAVRGGQLILRVASSKTNCSSSGPNGSHSRPTLGFVLPYGDRCYILEQSMDVLEKIFHRLTPRELALLSLTCRAMHLVVSQFLEHVCSSYNMRAKLVAFYEKNHDLLLPKELVFKERLECNSRHELLLYSAMRQFIGNVNRVSLCHVDQFDHLAKAEMIIKERDVALKRDVVVLKRVRWLFFRHTFRNVQPGKYVFQLRMRLANVRWDKSLKPEAPARVKVSQHTSRGIRELIQQKVDPSWWSKLEIHQSHSDLKHASFIFDRDSDWMFMRFEPFEVKEDSCHLDFEFEDTTNPNWKQGMIWDFIELRSLVTLPNVTIS